MERAGRRAIKSSLEKLGGPGSRSQFSYSPLKEADMWDAEKVEFNTIAIRGKEYDAKMFGVVSVNPPQADSPWWEIDFTDGTTMVTNDVVTLRFQRKKGR
jgi:hypothetical protein